MKEENLKGSSNVYTNQMEYVKLILIVFLLMARGFWLVTTTVTNSAFTKYVEAFQPWVESLGGSVFAKDLDGQTVEGKGGKLAVIIDFPSKQAAIDAYNSSEYQELSKLRWANSTDTNITIMDGDVTH